MANRTFSNLLLTSFLLLIKSPFSKYLEKSITISGFSDDVIFWKDNLVNSEFKYSILWTKFEISFRVLSYDC